MPCTIGIIGLGKMAQGIILPLIERREILPQNIFAVVGQEKSVNSSLSKLPKGLKLFSSGDSRSESVWTKPIQLLAVKPQQLKVVEAQAQRSKSLLPTPKPLLISLLAGITLTRLQKSFPGHACVRAVPNAPVLVSAGITGLAWGSDVTSEQRLETKKIFNPISEVLEISEDQLDAFLALTSSGPAYVAVIAEALTDGAVAAGLPRILASRLTNQMLAGSALLLKEKELHPGQLKDMVASPAGTTIAGLRHLETAGVRSALIEAVLAAAERSRGMA